MEEVLKEIQKFMVNNRRYELEHYAILEFKEWLRQQVKYNSDNYTEEQLQIFDAVREKLYDVIEESVSSMMEE